MNRQILRGIAAAVSLFALGAPASAEVSTSQTPTIAGRSNPFQLFDVQFEAKLAAPQSFHSAVMAHRSVMTVLYQSAIQEVVGSGTCTASCIGWGQTFTSDASNIPYIRVDIQCFVSAGPIYYNYDGKFNASWAYKSCLFPVNSEYTDFEIYSTHGWSLDGVGYDQAYTSDDAHI